VTDRFLHRAAALLLALPLLANAPAAGARQPTLLQRLREWIGINPRQAVGGSRGSSRTSVCLITPRIEASTTGRPPTAVVSLPSPTLLAEGELNEVRLEQDGRTIWQKRASSTAAISGPIAWPLAPLTPGQAMLLRLRPRGAAGGDFADVQLRAASAEQQREALALLANPSARLQAIETAATKGHHGLASGLVFAPLANPSSELTSLRQKMLAAGCSNSQQ
jgi:hypothetical protein